MPCQYKNRGNGSSDDDNAYAGAADPPSGTDYVAFNNDDMVASVVDESDPVQWTGGAAGPFSEGNRNQQMLNQ